MEKGFLSKAYEKSGLMDCFNQRENGCLMSKRQACNWNIGDVYTRQKKIWLWVAVAMMHGAGAS